MIKQWLRKWLGIEPPRVMPKYRLVPEENGLYMLEKYHYEIAMYLAEVPKVRDQEHAEQLIANLERPIMELHNECT